MSGPWVWNKTATVHQVYSRLTAPCTFYWTDPLFTSGTLTSRFKIIASGNLALPQATFSFSRLSSSQYRYVTVVTGAPGKVYLGQMGTINGTPPWRRKAILPIALKRWYNLRVEIGSAAGIDVYLDEQKLVSHATMAPVEGAVGVFTPIKKVLFDSFAFNGRPGAFSKAAPANGATDQSASPTLMWGSSTGAASYEYCIDTTNDDACGGSWTSNGTATSADLSGLGTGSTYYWQVRAVNARGTTYSDTNTWWSFTTSSTDPNLLVCSGCHSGTPPAGSEFAPNVYTYWDGSWWDNLNAGSNSVQQGGHGDPDRKAALTCVGTTGTTGCHDLRQSSSTHQDGRLGERVNASSNTYHLRTGFIKSSPVNPWDIQVTFDNFCYGQCHAAIYLMDCRHTIADTPEPAPGAVEFGKHLSKPDGRDISWPLDSDISTRAASPPKFAPCVACHDPHGTATAFASGGNLATSSNRMLRSNPNESSSCFGTTGCH